MRNILFFFFLFFVFSSCSDVGNITGEGLAPPSSPDADTTYIPAIEDIKSPEIIEDIQESACNEECQYQMDCWDCASYFCPPLDAVWQKQICIDRCVDPPTVISESKCTEQLECDPSQHIIGSEDCITESGYPGRAIIYCNKGHKQLGPCETDCFPEICDNLDNNCDGEIDEGFSDSEEVCNSLDDNCNGLIDEGISGDCENDCGPGDIICVAGTEVCIGDDPEEEICNYVDDDCDGDIDEGQRNSCNKCGAVPEEICDGVDNDCDGLIDEDLVDICETDCEINISYCVNGTWGCTALPPTTEICDGLDNDCDGDIDEELDCGCSFFGILLPCNSSPLECGTGFRTCICTKYELNWLGEEDCIKSKVTECTSYCYAINSIDPFCVKSEGDIVDEVCNNWDDDCDTFVDEDLNKPCYTGPPETLDVGTCKEGDMMCFKGKWGNTTDEDPPHQWNFLPAYCKGQVLPKNDVCNESDDNCDGVIDDGKEMVDTDILLILDVSGSMDIEIDAVLSALNMFANNYSDEKVLQWGVITAPMSGTTCSIYGLDNACFSYDEYLLLYSNLSPFSTFISEFTGLGALLGISSTGLEMLYDAIYFSLYNLVAPSNLPYLKSDLEWFNGWGATKIFSEPEMDKFVIDWREDAHRVIITFSDEEGASFLKPEIQLNMLVNMTAAVEDLYIYSFSPSSGYGIKDSWEPLSTFGGKWFKLTTDPEILLENLSEILDEAACGGTK